METKSSKQRCRFTHQAIGHDPHEHLRVPKIDQRVIGLRLLVGPLPVESIKFGFGLI
jgi:hypothetical protein